MEASFWTAVGALAVLALITVVGIRAGSKIKSAKDFTTGSGMGVPMVAGSLIGTLVGGASTIGTAQLAFTYGLSAWWFTLGGGIGLAIMAAWFVGPLRRSGLSTLPQILTKEYGKQVATAAALLMSIGTFISIVSQLLSAVLGHGRRTAHLRPGPAKICKKLNYAALPNNACHCEDHEERSDVVGRGNLRAVGSCWNFPEIATSAFWPPRNDGDKKELHYKISPTTPSRNRPVIRTCLMTLCRPSPLA